NSCCAFEIINVCDITAKTLTFLRVSYKPITAYNGVHYNERLLYFFTLERKALLLMNNYNGFDHTFCFNSNNLKKQILFILFFTIFISKIILNTLKNNKNFTIYLIIHKNKNYDYY